MQALGSLPHPLATSCNGTLPSLTKRKTLPNLQALIVYMEPLAIRYVFYFLVV